MGQNLRKNMRWKCDDYIDSLVKETREELHLIIELKCSSYPITDTRTSKKVLEKYLQRRGYVANYVLGVTIWVRAFVCVRIHTTHVELWHDLPNHESINVGTSILTGLPIALKYMEKL